MILALNCFLSILNCAYACNLYSDSELLKYSLHKNSGQVVRDVSGNNYHGLNGDSLHSEAEDVVWTDRGAFFNGAQHITLGNPLVSENPLILSRNFTLVLWIYTLKNVAYIFGSENYLKLVHRKDELAHTYGHEEHKFNVSESFKSELYLDKWTMFSLMFTYYPTYAILRVAQNKDLYPETTVSAIWEDSPNYDHWIGKRSANMKGFLYEFTIYDEPLSSLDTLFVSSSLCQGYPPSLDKCIPEVEDPMTNSYSQLCACNDNSCRSDANDCIECECDLNCSTSSPYSCIDFETEFCCPYSFDTSSLTCDYSSCCEGFFFDQISSSCSSSCPPGFLGNTPTRRCEQCDSACSECEGTASYCSSCTDTNSFASGGTCVCSIGYLENISTGICEQCDSACSECEGTASYCLSCTDPNTFASGGTCVCSIGYLENISTGICEQCDSACSECEGTATYCLSCTDTNSFASEGTCVCSIGYFENASTGICEQCDSVCSECEGTASYCLSCTDTNSYAPEGTCVCSLGYFENASTGMCEQCDSACSECEGTTSYCLSCTNTNSFASEGTCVCSSGFFENASTGICEQCESDCSECEGTASYCLFCTDPNTFASGGTCVCSIGFFAASLNPLQCCPETCTDCNEDSNCIDCIQNASLKDGNCLCDSGYFLNSNFECEQCEPYCLECEERRCLECQNNMIPKDTECMCEGEMREDECFGYFSISAELKEDTWIELKSEERVILTEDLFKLELRSSNCTVISEINSENSLIFKVEFSILDKFLEGEYVLSLTFAENIVSQERNMLQTQSYSFPVEFSIDRGISFAEQVCISCFMAGIFVSFVSMVTLNEPTALWTICRKAQYISYLLILDLEISDSLYRFFRTYNTAIFIPNLGVEYIESTGSSPPDSFRMFGLVNKEFEDTNVLRNGARFFVLFAGILIIHAVICALSYVLPFKWARNKRDVLKRKLLGCLIRLWIMLGLDFLVYASVTLFDNQTNLACNLIANVIFVIGNTSPVVFYLIIRKNEELIRSKDEKTMNYFDSLVSGIELSSKLGIFYEVFMAFRNLIFLYTLYWMGEYWVTFCVIQLIISSFFLILISCCKIFEKKLFMIANILSEICLSVLFIGLILLEHLEPEEQNFMEYTIQGTCVAFILFATFAPIVWSLIKKCRDKRRNGKEDQDRSREREDNSLAPGQIQPLGKIDQNDNSFRQQLFYFFEPPSASQLNIIHRSRDNNHN